jgi:hypothetical protein
VICLVPFCRHTRRLHGEETVASAHAWICGDHWRLVPVRLKRRRQRIMRIWRKASKKNQGRIEYRARLLYWRQWEQIRIAAIEISVGITAARPRR